MIQCIVCGDSCGHQALYVGSRAYCVSCWPYRMPSDPGGANEPLLTTIPTGQDIKRVREWAGADVATCATRLGVTAEQLISFEEGLADNRTYRAVKEGWQRLLCGWSGLFSP